MLIRHYLSVMFCAFLIGQIVVAADAQPAMAAQHARAAHLLQPDGRYFSHAELLGFVREAMQEGARAASQGAAAAAQAQGISDLNLAAQVGEAQRIQRMANTGTFLQQMREQLPMALMTILAGLTPVVAPKLIEFVHKKWEDRFNPLAKLKAKESKKLEQLRIKAVLFQNIKANTANIPEAAALMQNAGIALALDTHNYFVQSRHARALDALSEEEDAPAEKKTRLAKSPEHKKTSKEKTAEVQNIAPTTPTNDKLSKSVDAEMAPQEKTPQVLTSPVTQAAFAG